MYVYMIREKYFAHIFTHTYMMLSTEYVCACVCVCVYDDWFIYIYIYTNKYIYI